MKRFENKIAIVTGGGSGIGEATAIALANEGARVIIADINTATGETVANKISGLFIKTNVGSSAEIDALVHKVIQQFGALHILVNNAFRSETSAIEKMSDKQWRQTLEVTLDGVFYGSRAALKVMTPGGVIVNVASISGLGGDYAVGAYNTAKAGVINLTHTIAIESGKKGIRVNAVCPGVINTPPIELLWQVAPQLEGRVRETIPLGRFGKPEDVAKTILFLCSADAAYVHGSTLVVDGGLTASSGIPQLIPDT